MITGQLPEVRPTAEAGANPDGQEIGRTSSRPDGRRTIIHSRLRATLMSCCSSLPLRHAPFVRVSDSRTQPPP